MIKLRENYDVIVIGAGPAGSIAARTVAQAGHSVLLIEKRQEIGSPVRCAEGLSQSGLEKFVQIDPKWICTAIDKYRLHAPDGTAFAFKPGNLYYVLERKIFDRDLANMAVQVGAQVIAKATACGLLRDDNGAVAGVQLNISGMPDVPVKAKIVIGADGVESQVGRWAGIDTVPRLHDMHSTVQYLVAGLEVDEGTCDFYFGSTIAPGGYLWIFPKGKGMANVGLGVVARRTDKTPAQTLLDRFIEAKYPESSILAVVVGGIPLGGTLREIVKDGLMLIGDAAHQAFPHTGGGIENAMLAGLLAGQVAAEAVAIGDFSHRFLIKYSKQWNHTLGSEISWLNRMKQLAASIDDQTLNRCAAQLAGLDLERLTTKEVLIAVVSKEPGLLLKARHFESFPRCQCIHNTRKEE